MAACLQAKVQEKPSVTSNCNLHYTLGRANDKLRPYKFDLIYSKEGQSVDKKKQTILHLATQIHENKKVKMLAKGHQLSKYSNRAVR